MNDRKPKDDVNLNTPTRQFVSYRVARTHARLARQGSRILKKVAGISRVEWWVIGALKSSGGERLSDIARSSGMDKGQLSRAIKLLISQGLVEASNTEADLRNQHLKLTRSGNELYDRTLPHMMRRQDHLMAILTKEERQVLYAALDKIAAATEQTEFPDSETTAAPGMTGRSKPASKAKSKPKPIAARRR